MPPKNSKIPLVVILDNVRSLYNVGAIFRTCNGAGVEKLYLTGITGYPTQSKRAQRQIEKTALSTIPHVEWEYHSDTPKLLKMLKLKKYQVVALEQTKDSLEYTKTKYKFPLALVVGHETLGVSKDVLKLAELVVHIPMHGHAKSLNVATATGIMVYHLRNIWYSKLV